MSFLVSGWVVAQRIRPVKASVESAFQLGVRKRLAMLGKGSTGFDVEVLGTLCVAHICFVREALFAQALLSMCPFHLSFRFQNAC